MQELVDRIGIDKLTHLGWGGWLAGLVVIVLTLADIPGIGWGVLLWATVALAVVLVLAFLKEVFSQPDWKDFAWSAAGAATVYLAVVFGVLLNKGHYGW